MQSFSAYMQEWLYGRGGYYAKMPCIGTKGDFYTSVSTSMFFGGSIANYLMGRIQDGYLSSQVNIIEIGAHKGYLLGDLVQFIYTLKPSILNSLHFIIVEPLERVRVAQEEYFSKAFENKVSFSIVEDLSCVRCHEAFIVANELFDAFKCEVVFEDEMLFIHNHTPRFQPITQELKEIATHYGITKGEVPLGYDKFVKTLCKNIEKFEFITFDYGDRWSRNDISLRVYKKHQTTPFFELTSLAGDKERLDEFFQKSDITYDVNFQILIDTFEKEGLALQKYVTQMVALNDFGIVELLDILRHNVDEKIYSQELEKAKQLLLPNFLGERFKMASFTKDMG